MSTGVSSALSGVLRRMLMRPAVITEAVPVAGLFYILTLEGPALSGVSWTAGQKAQIAVGSSLLTRTYTPIDWDETLGRFRILCFAHGDGPGSTWARGALVGDECDVFGPRASIEARSSPGPIAVFGDETSIGLAAALSLEHGAGRVRAFFEVDDTQAAGKVLEALRLRHVTLFERRPGDAHLDQMETVLPSLTAAGSFFVLSGKAATVQRLRRSLKQTSAPTARVAVKAYWAPGKVGLD
jgi:NADPH-dependent ferric siderophore reductase